MKIEQLSIIEKLLDANLGIRDLGDHRVLEFDSKDPKICEAYITAIADILSRMWPDKNENHPQHIKDILLASNVVDGKIKSGYFSFPLSFHDAVMDKDDKRMLDKIHEKAHEIYVRITT